MLHCTAERLCFRDEKQTFPLSPVCIHWLLCFVASPAAGQDKGEGNRHQHFHAKERLPAGGGESVCPAALHLLLHPTGVQPPAAVPPVQPDRTAGLVSHAQLHRPHAGHPLPQQPVHQRVYGISQLQASHVPAGSQTLLAKEQVHLRLLWMIVFPAL